MHMYVQVSAQVFAGVSDPPMKVLELNLDPLQDQYVL